MRIHAITTGHVRVKKAQIEGRGHGLRRQLQPILSPDWADWVPVYVWIVEHPEGVIVVDTGANAGLKSLPRWHPYFQFSVCFDIEAEQEIGPQLRNLGIGARDVKTVVLTHMHIDHDGGLAHFPHSRVVASAEEIRRASGIRGALLGYLPNRWPKWFDPEPLAWQASAYGPFAQSARLTKSGDVIAVPTPGHTPNHVSVIVRTGDNQIMLAGDTSYLESTMLRAVLDGVSSDEAMALATLANIRALCAQRPTIYLPSHDPKSAERLEHRRAVNAPDQSRATNRDGATPPALSPAPAC
jgi:N-acyl homoserine lactone hydrolase